MNQFNVVQRDICRCEYGCPRNFEDLQPMGCVFMGFNFQDYAARAVYAAAVLDLMQIMHFRFAVQFETPAA